MGNFIGNINLTDHNPLGDTRDLRGADLRIRDLTGQDLSDRNFRGADLSGADLVDTDLRNSNLCHADLRVADLRCADLRGADLRCADLRGADLRGADLRHTDTQGANFSGAIFNEHTIMWWRSNEMIAGRLQQAAHDDNGIIEVAAIIAARTEWCWSDFVGTYSDDPRFARARDIIMSWDPPEDIAKQLRKINDNS